MDKLSIKKNKVLVAVNFDANGRRLVQCAAALCRRSGMSLCLAHVAESELHSYLSYSGAAVNLWPEILETIENESVAGTESRLREMAQEATGVDVEVNVQTGTVADGLLRAITETGASLVIVGSAKGAHKALLRGFSTAVALMNDSPVPIIVLPGDSNLDFSKDRFCVIIADDLREDTAEIADLAFEIAGTLNSSEILHLHVSTMTEDMFKAAMAAALASARSNGEHSPSELWRLTRLQVEAKLEKRNRAQKEVYASSSMRIKSLCEVGRIETEILRQISSVRADITIFGRHQRFHGKDMLYGQVPMHLMLALEKPIMIVPARTKA